MSFISQFGGNAATNQSGLGSLDKALAAGMTVDQIRASGVNFGPAAANKLDMLSNSFVGQYGGNLNTNQAGVGSINKALASGMSIAEIQNKKVNWGPEAKSKLFPTNSQQQSFIQKFGGTEETGQSGLSSLDRALQAGLTYDKIADMGINFGPKAADVLSRGAGSGFIGKYGGDIDLNATGLSSVLRAQNDGMSTKDIAKLSLNFGPEALKYLTEANKPKPELPKMYKPQMMSVGNLGNASGVRPKTNKNSKDGITGYSRDKLKKTKSVTPAATAPMSILGLNI